MKSFNEDLQKAITYHGHLCSGQILGVRMSRLALQLMGIDEPEVFRDLVVYVECDRCLTDAIGTVTGCKLGKRNLKWLDYGKSAATFLNLQTGKALRISKKVYVQPPKDTDALLSFFESLTDNDLFSVQNVRVRYRQEDLPGRPLDAMTCPQCHEEVIDGRQVVRNGVALCRACAESPYYEVVNSHESLATL